MFAVEGRLEPEADDGPLEEVDRDNREGWGRSGFADSDRFTRDDDREGRSRIAKGRLTILGRPAETYETTTARSQAFESSAPENDIRFAERHSSPSSKTIPSPESDPIGDKSSSEDRYRSWNMTSVVSRS